MSKNCDPEVPVAVSTTGSLGRGSSVSGMSSHSSIPKKYYLSVSAQMEILQRHDARKSLEGQLEKLAKSFVFPKQKGTLGGDDDQKMIRACLMGVHKQLIILPAGINPKIFADAYFGLLKTEVNKVLANIQALLKSRIMSK